MEENTIIWIYQINLNLLSYTVPEVADFASLPCAFSMSCLVLLSNFHYDMRRESPCKYIHDLLAIGQTLTLSLKSWP